MSRAERRRFDAAEQLQRLYDSQGGVCWTCGRHHDSAETMERAHRVADTKANRARYGARALDDDENKRAVCRGGMYKGRSCNDSCMVSGDSAPGRALMARIQRRHRNGVVVEV